MESEVSRITAILSIALVSILALLVINLVKVYALKKENAELKKQISKQ